MPDAWALISEEPPHHSTAQQCVRVAAVAVSATTLVGQSKLTQLVGGGLHHSLI